MASKSLNSTCPHLSAAYAFALCLTVACCFSVQTLRADTVFLKRGGSLQGQVVEGDKTVEIHLDGGSTVFNKTEIDHIEKDDSTGQKDGKPGSFSSTLSTLKADAGKVIHKAKAETTRTMQSVKKQTAGWMKPIERSPAAKAQEQMVNKTLDDMRVALQKTHDRDKAISEQKRALKNDGFDIN